MNETTRPEADEERLAAGRRVLEIEAETLRAQRLDASFLRACDLLGQCRGRVITTGVGKSGHIAAKAAATLASTGTPAFFMHPTEAGHGDLGMVQRGDVILALSYSGESGELLLLLPALAALEVPLVVISGNPQSRLARAAAVHLPLTVAQEACPLNLAPTSSTTASLALCDALAVVLMRDRNFQPQDFARSHPLGRLGRRLTLRVRDVMRADVPLNRAEDSMETALYSLTSKGVGATLIAEAGALHGIFTDGDLRRALQRGLPLSTPLAAVMSPRPRWVGADELALNALNLMHDAKIAVLPVLDGGALVGILQLHDLAGLL